MSTTLTKETSRQAGFQPTLFSRLMSAPTPEAPEVSRLSTLRSMDLHAPRAGRFFSMAQRAQLRGRHHRSTSPILGRRYLASIIIQTSMLRTGSRDAATVTIGELVGFGPSASLHIVQHDRWEGADIWSAIPRLLNDLSRTWKSPVVVGVEDGHALTRLQHLAGSQPMFTKVIILGHAAKTGDALLHALDHRLLKVYAPDGSEEHNQFWTQIVKAQGRFSHGSVDFFIDRGTGDDSYLAGLALLTKEARREDGRSLANTAVPA